jgi:metal-responsive CopG/Arc/MetJ family transcriptional regulator
VLIPKRGRPSTGRDPVRTLRLSDHFLDKIDHWATKQEDQPGRSEAIRRLVQLGLKVKK